jgi:hypothetical protein
VGLVVMLLRRRSTEALVPDMERDMGGSRWVIFVYTLGMLEWRRCWLLGLWELLNIELLKGVLYDGVFVS